jgi:iron complex transport system substrate-binding protein
VTSSALQHSQPAAVDAAVREAAAESRPLFTLDEATIRALQPTVIVTQGLCEVCAVSDAEVRRLAASLPSPARVVSLGARTFDAVLDSMLELAAVLGRDGATSEDYLGLQVRMRRVHETLKAADPGRAWGLGDRSGLRSRPLGSGHGAPGGRIDVGAPGGTHGLAASMRCERPRPSPDAPALLSRAVVEAGAARARREWARGLRLTAIDGNALTSRPGPRVVDGIEVMARLFHPDLFTPIAPGRGTVVSLV